MIIYNDPIHDLLTIKVTEKEVKQAFSDINLLWKFREDLIALIEEEIKDNEHKT